MWDNQNGLLAAQTKFTGAREAVQNHGDEIWDIITYLGCDGEPFAMDDIVETLMKAKGLARRTAYSYVCAFISYCRAVPNSFSGPASKLVRVKRGFWRLEDNPER